MAASKLKQLLLLDPSNEIAFQGPFEHVVTSYLELKNPYVRPICFKVKTTAPKRYCVRPNSGIVEPDGKVKIAIMLQPLDPDSEAEARTKHKFMVQSTIINSDDENIPLDEVWQNAKQEHIMDSKLRCVFHSPERQEGDGDVTSAASAAAALKQRNTDGGGFGTEISGGNMLSSDRASASTTTTTATTTTGQQAEQARKQRASGDGQRLELISTSTPVTSRNVPSSTTKQWGSSSSASQNLKFGQGVADKSATSSHNLTSSFLQPMSDDYKIVLISLAMLVLGVILGKYII